MSVAPNPLRSHLLPGTLAWCVAKSKFYADTLVNFEQVREISDLPRLPLLHRDDILKAGPAFLCDSGTPQLVQYTTGTTGTFLPLHRSAEEVAFIQQFFGIEAAERLRASPVRPLWLALTSAYHGAPTAIPGAAYVLPAGVYDRTQASQARRLLEARHSMPGVESGVSAIVGGDILLKALTAFLIGEGVDLRSLGVRTLMTTGGYVSPGRKARIAELWGARLVDRYSMAEVFGGATEIGTGGPWMFDPYVIPEVVHPVTGAPIESGVGVLALTGLYPFMQTMPMVRYLTGDLVRIVRPSSAGELLVQFVGRARRSLFVTHSDRLEPLVLSAELHAILEGLPDIAAVPRFPDLGVPGLELAGKLRYAVDSELGASGRGWIRITLGVRFTPWMFPHRTAEIQTQVRGGLYAASEALRSRVDTGEVTLEIDIREGESVAPFNAK